MSEMERADPSDFSDPPPPPPPGSTIDEPVSETILRDVRLVGRRLSLVMLPGVSASARSAALRDWDLWGPLFVCMSLAVLLSVESSGEGSLLFSLIFVIVWAGAAVVTINGQLLGGRLAFFGSVCLLGYCIAPLLVAAGGCALVNATVGGGVAVVVRFALVVTGLAWSVWGELWCSVWYRFPILCAGGFRAVCADCLGRVCGACLACTGRAQGVDRARSGCLLGCAATRAAAVTFMNAGTALRGTHEMGRYWGCVTVALSLLCIASGTGC